MSGILRILVIDDEPSVRQQVEDMLSRRGHVVRSAMSGEEGLGFALSDTYDVALIDVRMPGIDGVETMHEIHRIKPGLPVVLMSGYSDVDSANMIAEGAAAWLDKPFTDIENVCETLTRVSEGGSDSCGNP